MLEYGNVKVIQQSNDEQLRAAEYYSKKSLMGFES